MWEFSARRTPCLSQGDESANHPHVDRACVGLDGSYKWGHVEKPRRCCLQCARGRAAFHCQYVPCKLGEVRWVEIGTAIVRTCSPPRLVITQSPDGTNWGRLR